MEIYVNGVFVSLAIVNRLSKHPILYKIEIKEEYRSQGFGTLLLEKSCQEIANLGIRRCYLVNDNKLFWQKIKERYLNRIANVILIENK